MSITADISAPTAVGPSPRELNVPQQLNTARGTMRFREAPGVCGLGLFTYLSAVTAALTLRVPQDSVNGTAGRSVLLPVSYTVPDSHGYLRITWTRAGAKVVECTSVSEERSPYITVSDPYKHRAIVFPENASLLLGELQIDDSGIYELSVSHSMGTAKRNLTLVVRPDIRNRNNSEDFPGTGNQSDTRDTTGTNSNPVSNLELIGPPVSSAVILIILCVIVKMRRGKHDINSVYKGSQEQKEAGHTTQGDWVSATKSYVKPKSAQRALLTGHPVTHLNWDWISLDQSCDVVRSRVDLMKPKLSLGEQVIEV
ncbi:uncharacterized protein LOC127585842 [Pristis pectinata]|uniref:uncharacterized protein LOC127585842 n=1 Tax=Pristis pectinata TaxID=685728 RepID=UPI00223DE11D|nr:uncharacterized protein LOC127585842 [Pristis pectinata]